MVQTEGLRIQKTQICECSDPRKFLRAIKSILEFLYIYTSLFSKETLQIWISVAMKNVSYMRPIFFLY